MRQFTFGIFAHPDDAAFGPSGTLKLAAQHGAAVHLICLTDGDAGMNVDGHDDLAEVRAAEERRAAELIGAASLEQLHYPDGSLCNNVYLEIAGRIAEYVRRIADPEDDITLITFDRNGLTGHIDHITTAMATTHVYLTLRDTYRLRLKYFCLPASRAPHATHDWIYSPQGRASDEIDEIVDVSDLKSDKLAIMQAHHTQRSDAEHMIAMMGDELYRESFYFYKD